MTPTEKEEFIEKELYHELRCLLGAATVWQIYKKNGMGFDVIVAMDASFIHARNLFIFFAPTKEDKNNQNSIKVTEFGPSKPYTSRVYSTWKSALNRHLFHLNKKRLRPTNLKNSGHLNEKVEVFAKEILMLWKKLESDPDAVSFQAHLKAAREQAISDAKNDADGRIVPSFVQD